MKIVRGLTPFEVENAPSVSSWEFWRLWAEGNWEELVFAEMDRLLPPGGCLLDIGAWVGPFTLWGAQRGRVVAFEPDPEALRQLRLNVTYNNLHDRVRIIGAAAAVTDGTMLLHSVREWGESTSSTTVDLGHVETVPAVCLLDVIREEKPDLVKMDVEGGESYLIPAVEALLRERGVPILLSIHPMQADITEAWELLKAGWELIDIDYGGGEVFLCLPRRP